MTNRAPAATETVELWRRHILSGIVWACFWFGTIACIAGVAVAAMERPAAGAHSGLT